MNSTSVNHKTNSRAWILVLVYTACIFVWSSLPGSSPILKGLEKYVWDKFLHLLEYLVLGILLVRALSLSIRYRGFEHLVFMTFALGSFYALTDEWHQSFVPMRDASLYDWMTDSVGVLFGAVIWAQKIIKESKKETNA